MEESLPIGKRGRPANVNLSTRGKKEQEKEGGGGPNT